MSLSLRSIAAVLMAAMLASPLWPASGGGGLPPFFGGDPERERQAEAVLARYYDVSRRNIVRGVTMVAHFAARLPKLGKSGEIEARREVDVQGVVHYTEVMQRNGDSTVQKDIIARFMNGESDPSASGKDSAAITPLNYKFKFKGLQTKEGRQVYVIELNPRKKRVGLFKGEVWLDADTGLTLREAGRFVKSPSIFLKRIDFAREYTIRDGYSIPKSLQTTIQTRFWGPAELEVTYSDFAWEYQPPAVAVTGSTVSGDRP
jgi:hypothetical protein